MAVSISSRRAVEVVIAGGGFAALEAALALRSLASERVRLTLIAPDPVFAYRPAATAEAFGGARPRVYDLEAIVGDLGGVYRRDRLEGVAPRKKYVRLASGPRLGYDALILAMGARARAGVPGALTFRDQRDVPRFRRLLQELREAAVGRLVFVVPPGLTWPLPVYELALLSSSYADDHGVTGQITLVSSERSPLAIFGAEASRLVADLLSRAEVDFVGGCAESSVRRDGSLVLDSGGRIEADRVVAVPQLRANRVRGVPANRWGFVATDTSGRVERLMDVYAAGDVTTSPIKQGGLAAQQADRVADAIAAGMGVPAQRVGDGVVLGAQLLGGERPLLLCVELDDDGHPAAATLVHGETDELAARSKVFGRYLTPYLERRDRLDLSSAGRA
jgi:sulfide:quinone oxidoreductase